MRREKLSPTCRVQRFPHVCWVRNSFLYVIFLKYVIFIYFPKINYNIFQSSLYFLKYSNSFWIKLKKIQNKLLNYKIQTQIQKKNNVDNTKKFKKCNSVHSIKNLIFIIEKSAKRVVHLLTSLGFYNDTKVAKFSTYPYHHCILSFQKHKNNGNIYTYRKARDHVVVLVVFESLLIWAFAFVRLLKLTYHDFLPVLRSVE